MNLNRFLLILILFLFISCQDSLFYSSYQSLPEGWSPNEKLEFILPEADSTETYNIFIHLRNTNHYPFSNLFLIAAIQFPNGKVVTDTLEYQMAYTDGTWMGHGGKVKENKLWYKENIRFFETGNYKIQLKQAMRTLNQINGVKLEGVTDVGISIEKAVQ